ncbi:hypothetical protein X737_06060 [Mesorhizobium sp. L48C026A00]|nr:hypothetical protein X737_06060 [Mesorhizobium sp. L48C026A00]
MARFASIAAWIAFGPTFDHDFCLTEQLQKTLVG